MRALLLSISLLLCFSCENSRKNSHIFTEKRKPITPFNGTMELRFLKSISINYSVSTISQATTLPFLNDLTIDSTHRYVLAIRINPSSQSYRMKHKVTESTENENVQLTESEALLLIYHKLQSLYTVSQWEIDSIKNYRDSTRINLTGRLVLSSPEPFWEESVHTFISKLEELTLVKADTEYRIGELANINRDYRNRRERQYQEGDFVVTAKIKSNDLYRDIAQLKQKLRVIPNSYYLKFTDSIGVEFKP